jgi:hypothetical protein
LRVEKQNLASPKSTATFASSGQKPLREREKVSGLPKAFNWDGFDTVFFLRSLRVLRGLHLLTKDFGSPKSTIKIW